MCRIYEGMINEKISIHRYEVLNTNYDKEQRVLKEEKILRKQINNFESDKKDRQKFIDLISKYDKLENLNTIMINEFVEKIVVHELERKYITNSKQKIEIYFKYKNEINNLL